MSDELAKKKCAACEKKTKAFERAEAENYLAHISGWVMDTNAQKISKEFEFKDFVGSVDFVNRVADIAEEEGHHPDIEIHYNKVKLILWTHAIDGLSENDFIVAAKVDAYNKF